MVDEVRNSASSGGIHHSVLIHAKHVGAGTLPEQQPGPETWAKSQG